MSPIWIVLTGLAVVVGGILALRLHAFLALLLGALTVAALNPSSHYADVRLAESAAAWERNAEGAPILVNPGGSEVGTDATLLVVRRDTETNAHIRAGVVRVVSESAGVVRLVASSPDLQLREGDRLVTEAAFTAAQRYARRPFASHVADGFGQTALSIGILIAMAAIIGKCLLDSGAATRIVLALQRMVGERRTGLAFAAGGFVTAIPVFFDTVFYLMLPLAKAFQMRTGRGYLLLVLAVVAGGTMAHSLVPPTPGPLFVASELGIDLGVMIIAGLIVGVFTSSSGYLYAVWADRRWSIPLRPSAELTGSELEEVARRDESTLPNLVPSLVPIALPLLLIAGSTFVDIGAAEQPSWWSRAVVVLGEKNFALVLGALAGLGLLFRQRSGDVREAVQSALASGGIIILITSAGGAFGHVLRLSGIAGHLQEVMPVTAMGLIPVAFLLTSLVRIAQGSATVAMITSVGIVAPMIAGLELAFHPVYIALAIGCGSKPISWMNDSGFWIIGRMAGLTEAETLKTWSVQITLMGLVGLLVVLLAAWLIPLA